MIVYANPSNEGSLGSGYYVTTNWHGVDVPPGTGVIATAKTTDHDVDQVTFTWINPAGQTVWTETVPVQFDGTYYGYKKVYSATSTYTPEALGDWTVKALFIDQSGHLHCCCTSEVARRATSFNVIPEIPLIGTAGASIAMFAGLAVKMKRKPQH
jgi:hypothetical protein